MSQRCVALGEVVTYNLSVAGQTSIIIMAARSPTSFFGLFYFVVHSIGDVQYMQRQYMQR